MDSAPPLPPPPNGEADRPTDGGWDAASDLTLKKAAVRLLHPVPLTVLLILLSVLALIAANVLGWDKGDVLSRMADHEFARGLITYLFAVTTIGTAVVLLLAALMGSLVDHAYQRAKEILALLLGVFGTIVGFYFGSEAHSAKAVDLTVSQPLLSATAMTGGDSVRLTAFAAGGDPPYTYAITFGVAKQPTFTTIDTQTGWIIATVGTPAVTAQIDSSLVLAVKDAKGKTSSRSSTVTLRPRPK